MKFFFACGIFLLSALPGNFLIAQDGVTGIRKSQVYSAMAGKDEAAVNKLLDLLKQASIPEKDAYEGALLMKKAGLVPGAKKKLNLFKQGHRELEAVLQKDSSNTEFRFLRLMIQENAPGILGYKGNLESDNLYIRDNFKKLPPVVQQAALDYSKVSKKLKLGDL